MYKQYKVHNLPFATLEVGETFEIEDVLYIPYIRCQAVSVGKRLNRKFSVSSTLMRVKRTK